MIRWQNRTERAAVRLRAREAVALSRNLRWVAVLRRALKRKLG